MRLLLTAIFLLTATQAFSEIRQGVCTVTHSKRLNFSTSNWFPPEAIPVGTRMTILYDEDTVVINRGDAREEFTVFFTNSTGLEAVRVEETPMIKTTVVYIGDRNCALSRGVQSYRGEHRDMAIYTVGDFPTRTIASCPCANLD